MAHIEQMWFFQNCKNHFPRYFKGKNILEIGSLNINGSIRVFFNDCEFKGIDIGSGEGVDEICFGENYAANANSYDVVTSTEVFEHAENWDLIVLNMVRLLKRDGLMIFTCASHGRKQHGTRLFDAAAAPYVASSVDYYKNLIASDFQEILNFDYWFSNYIFVEDGDCLYFAGLAKNEYGYNESMNSLKAGYDKYLYKRRILGMPHQYIIDNNLLD